MTINKWNEKLGRYEEHYIPNDWHIPLFCTDMDEIINCVNCGNKIKYGNGYTSHRYHTDSGIGYYECEECYFKYLPIYTKSKT